MTKEMHLKLEFMIESRSVEFNSYENYQSFILWKISSFHRTLDFNKNNIQRIILIHELINCAQNRISSVL